MLACKHVYYRYDGQLSIVRTEASSAATESVIGFNFLIRSSRQPSIEQIENVWI